MVGRFSIQSVVIKVDMHVGDDGAVGFRAVYPFECSCKVGVAGVWFVAQGVYDPDFQVVQFCPRGIVDFFGVGQVGEVADAKA